MTHNNVANDKDIPVWNGLEETWADYVRDVEWLTFSTPAKHRDLLAARLARRLTGSAKQALKGLKARDFFGIQGLKKLMEILQSRIGVLPVPDLANKLDEFIFRLRRRVGEPMNDWGLRSTEAYRLLTVALDRVRGQEVEVADFGIDILSDRTNESEINWDQPLITEVEEDNPPVTPVRLLRSPGLATSTTSSPDRKALEAEPTKPEFLPTEVRGWLLLRNAGLSYQERATVIASTQGVLTYEVIWRALRQQYPSDIGRHDGRRISKKGTLMVYGAEIDWDLYEDDDEGYDNPGNLGSCEEEHEDEVDGEDWEFEPQLCARFQQAQRSLQQARDAIKQARMNRGFNPKGTAKGKFNKPSRTYGPKTTYSGPNKFGSSGSSSRNYDSYPSRHNANPPAPAHNHNGSLICVVCGQGHNVTNCPDRVADRVANEETYSFSNIFCSDLLDDAGLDV